MTIAKLLADRDHPVISCHPDDTVHQAAKLLAENRIGALPVMEDGRVVGIFSERDVLYSIASQGALALDRPVRAVMTSPAISITSDIKALDALGLMTRRRIRHLPVVDSDVLLGFVSIGDLVKQRIDQIEQEAQQLHEYIRTA